MWKTLCAFKQKKNVILNIRTKKLNENEINFLRIAKEGKEKKTNTKKMEHIIKVKVKK